MKEDKTKSFIDKAKKCHQRGNILYDKVVYVNNRTPVELYDTDLREDGSQYGTFWQTPSNHLKGREHPDKRGKNIASSKKITQEEIIKRFKEVHSNENMDYSEVVYTGMHNKVKIICHDLRPDGTEYGIFFQEPAVHLKGCTHPLKARYQNAEKQRYTNDEFIRRAKISHRLDDYDYSLVDYKSSKTKVKIICNKCGKNGIKHGVFETSPDLFLMGKGCPKCGNHLSVAEDELVNFISLLIGDEKVIRRDHKLLNGEELDIFIPSYSLAIEYDGLRWHSEHFNKDARYHVEKTLKCRDKGICLIHVFEDEYIKHKDLVFEKIEHFIGNKKDVIGARKCQIREITKKESECFLTKYHIQGFASASVYYGAFFNNEVLAVMSFINEGGGKWNLNRFATNINYSLPGVASKIFTHFIRNYNPDSVKSFLDRRWCFNEEDNLYTKLGFRQDAILPPDYRYTNGHGERLHKFGFRKQTLHKKYGLPLTMTETEMTEKLGYYKIWDCGLIRYVWENPARTDKNS
mgnify:CR=1 FL=1